MTLKAPAEIHTERMLLRKPRAQDAAAVFENYASDESLGQFLAWPIHRSIEETAQFLEFAEAEWQREPAGPYLVCLGDERTVIGSTGLAFDSPGRASTGYVIGHRWAGHGFATEAARAMVILAKNLGVERLTAYCHPDHTVSQRVLMKVGFERDSVLPEFCEFPNLSVGKKQSVERYVLRPQE